MCDASSDDSLRGLGADESVSASHIVYGAQKPTPLTCTLRAAPLTLSYDSESDAAEQRQAEGGAKIFPTPGCGRTGEEDLSRD
ncbi:hypothetical protein SKAU_G00281450 [Synaphobranchus kaupii]|uniref:Uncharacterized protein n=1 Tax=Synaphobranchus kaupii TaxID=118154 RepID=A0A9Q1EX47_SYNKA|nr:hypothetical protein SKAU_G00281450 [Synaphobranchus kaupii]